jgi:predicted dehydrogenase
MRTGGLGSYQDLSPAEGGGIVKNLGCHSLDLCLWLTDARSFRLDATKIERDGITDRRASAEVKLTDLGGRGQTSCELNWMVSWLDTVPNCYELEFDHAILRCPVAPADHIVLLDKNRSPITVLHAPSGSGATTSAQAFYLEWNDVLSCLEKRIAPTVSALSCLKVAELMDAILAA